MDEPEEMTPPAARRVRLGMLTPSSNTVIEPLTVAILRGLPEISIHFGRFRVTEISLHRNSLAQFDPVQLLVAARMLSDARVEVITWNGTSAAWDGFWSDEQLCRLITEVTGIAATSSILALNEIFAQTGVERFGLVTPYLDTVQDRIIANYAAAGYHCVAERHENQPGNFSFALISELRIAEMVRAVAAAKPDAIAIICTNLRGAAVTAALEAETGIPIYDTVATGLWKSLHLAGVDGGRVTGWGSLFSLRPGSGDRTPKPPSDQL